MIDTRKVFLATKRQRAWQQEAMETLDLLTDQRGEHGLGEEGREWSLWCT